MIRTNFCETINCMVLHNGIYPESYREHVSSRLIHNFASSFDFNPLLRMSNELRDPRRIDQIGVPPRINGGHVREPAEPLSGSRWVKQATAAPCIPKQLVGLRPTL